MTAGASYRLEEDKDLSDRPTSRYCKLDKLIQLLQGGTKYQVKAGQKHDDAGNKRV